MNMYIEFTSKQLQEFNKAVAVIQSCTDVTHQENFVLMLQGFGKICDRRAKQLLKRGWIGLLKFKNAPMEEYFKYKRATDEQVQHLIKLNNMWIEQYENWEKQQEFEMMEEEKRKNEKIDIVGFSKLLKKKRQKK